MRAWLLTRHGELDALAFDPAHPTPTPGPGEVVIRVDACGINNTDINTRVGWYAQGDDNGAWNSPLDFPVIQGADVCGVIAAVGDDVARERLGERVLVDPWIRDPAAPEDLERAGYVGSEHPGGYADFVAVPAVNALPVDARFAAVELASLPTAAGTAMDMVRRAEVGPGDHVVVTGASGGVGGYALQIAVARGATVTAVCSPEKAPGVLALGAAATCGRDDPLPDCDVVVDVVGGDRWSALLDALRRGGRYVVSGAIAGPLVELDLRTLYLKDLTLIGATVTPPGVFAEMVAMAERGDIRPTVAATFPLEHLREAQETFIAKRFVGKIVLDHARDAD